MPNDKNLKGKFIEKLHMILDDPYNNHKDIDEKILMDLRARLINDQNAGINRGFIGEDSLKATISIHKKPDVADLRSLPEFKEVESPDRQDLQKCDPFQDEDIYEVEKITTFIPLPDEALVRTTPKLSTSHDKKTVVFEPAEKDLPEWEPVEEDKKTDTFDSVTSKPDQEFKPVELETSKKEEIQIELFKDIPIIDDETALLLYNNNYRSLDDLKKTSAKELSKITGIKKVTARKIIKEIRKKSIKIPSTVFKPLKEESAVSETEEISEWEPVKEEKTSDTTSTKKEIESEDWEPISKKEIETPKKPIKKLKEKKEKVLPKIKKTPKKVDIKSEEETVFEPVEQDTSTVKTHDKIDVFKDISSIDDKTAKLLFENGINSIELLSVTPIKKLTKIKGIRKKIAKEIKKDVVEFLKTPIEQKSVSFTTETTSTKSKTEKEKNDEWEIRETEGYKHGEYTLFRKEIIVGFDKKRVIHFFSKSIPDDGEAIELPDGYEVRINKATGVPYLKKKK
jgi:hypothetical protein